MNELLIIVALVVANGFFAGAEIAVVALRMTRIKELAEQGRRGAGAVHALRQAPERFLATVQVGITVVGTTAAAFGGASIAQRLEPALAGVPWIGEHAEGVALAVVIVLVSFLSIVIGELVPKSLALRSAERVALLVGRPLLALSWLARPLVWLLSASANVVLKPFGDQTTFTETRHSAEELQLLVEEATRAGTLHPEAGKIAARALELPELLVADVMVPRQDVVMIARDALPERLRKLLLDEPHSRMPVYEQSVDNVVGYVSVKDLLALACDRQPLALETVLRKPYFVPESQRAVELLRDMRRRHRPFAIVVDEQGGMSGIVTMEDLLEELVGEIFSEHVLQVPELIKQEDDGSAIVSGKAPVREVNRALGVELPEEGPWTTVAGLYLAKAGRIPVAGESFEVVEGLTLDVVDASPRRIRLVRVRPTPSAEVSEGSEGREGSEERTP